MSRFISGEAGALSPYTPGEQPQDVQYIKLNTNESPFPPSPKVIEAVSAAEAGRLNLYSDPECRALNAAVAKRYGLRPTQVVSGNGSDELLAFAIRAFCGAARGLACADITYGFYRVWVRLFGLRSRVVPLREDFFLDIDDYLDVPETVVIANPNAPTGMALPVSEIRRLLETDRDRPVIVDEAYVDFGAESCVPLISEYDNLLVVQTFSKSRSLAGGRLGFAMGSEGLIEDINRVKFSFNPYNVNRLSLVAGAAAMADEGYFKSCTAAVVETRERTARELEALGFTVLPSAANFVFAKSNKISGGDLYRGLKARGILVRHFDEPRISDFCRITVGSPGDMRALLDAIENLLEV